MSVTRDARRRRGEGRGGGCLHFCLWAGDWREERGRGPERLSLMMDSHRRDRGGATQEDWGVSCDKIPGIQVIKLTSKRVTSLPHLNEQTVNSRLRRVDFKNFC